MSVLSQISYYRALRQSRDAGVSMGMDQILAIEALGLSLRKRSRQAALESSPAVLSTNSVEQVLVVKRLGPDSVVCTGCPGVLPSRSFGLRLDDADLQQSYLYRVNVSWIGLVSSEAECEVEFAFIGCPVVLRWGRGRSNAPEAVVELENKLCAA